MSLRTARRPAPVVGALAVGMLLAVAGALAVPLSASAATVTVTSSADSGPGSLRDVVASAVPGDVIQFDPSVTSIALLTTVTLPLAVTIDGGGAVTLSPDVGMTDALLTIAPTSIDQDFTITGLTFTGAPAAESRGILVETGPGLDGARSVTVSHSSLTSFRKDAGSAIDVELAVGTITVDASTIESNLATGDGGSAISITAPSSQGIVISNTTISGNITASGAASDGAVSINGTGASAPIRFTGDTIEGNVIGTGSDVLGAGISLGADGASIGDVTISGSTFTDNGDTSSPGLVVAEAGGGAYIGNAASVTVSASTFRSNSALEGGGGLVLDTIDGDVHLDRDTFDGNTASGGGVGFGFGPSGGGLFAGGVQGAFTMTDLVVENNTADGAGGGMLLVELESGFSVDTSTFSGNTSSTGAGIFVPELLSDTSSTVSGSTFSANLTNGAFGAGNGGGSGLFVEFLDDGASLIVQTSTFTANSYDAGGAGCGCAPPGLSIYVFDDEGDLGIADSTFDETSSTSPANPVQVDIVEADGTFGLANSTVVGDLGVDLGELDTTGIARVSHTIVQVPSGTDAITVDGVSAAQTLDVRWSLLSSGLGANETDTVGNQLNTDAVLAALANNGGPTQTMLPMTGSPAIDSGDPAFSDPVTVDQRGLARIVAVIDIGAVEVQTPAELAATGVPILGGFAAAVLLLVLGACALLLRRRRLA